MASTGADTNKEEPPDSPEAEARSRKRHLIAKLTGRISPLSEGQTWQKTPTGWPTEPLEFQSSWWTRTVVPIFDVFICLLPVAFLVFAGLAKSLNNKPVTSDDLGSRMLSTATYGVTIYTIVFTTIISRTMEYTASWMVERGASVFMLEQMLGSVSVFGAIRTQWLLRSLNRVSLILLLLWSMSPLGGQGTLRLLHSRSVTHKSLGGVWHFDSWRWPYNATIDDLYKNYLLDSLNALFSASLISPGLSDNSTADLWGNVRIPGLRDIAGDEPTDEKIPFDPADIESYVSIFGVPVINLLNKTSLANTEINFDMRMSYFDARCEPFRVVQNLSQIHIDHGASSPLPDNDKYTFSIGSFSNYNFDKKYIVDSAQVYGRFPARLYFASSILPNLDAYWFENAPPPKESISLGFALTFCNVTIQDVVASIKCDEISCMTTALQRLVQEDQSDLNYTNPLLQTGNTSLAQSFFQALSESTTRRTKVSSILECYLYFGTSGACLGHGQSQNLTTVNAYDFSRRFARILTTYWFGSLAVEYIPGTLFLGKDLSKIFNLTGGYNSHSPEFGDSRVSKFLDDTDLTMVNATFSKTREEYGYSPLWFSFVILSALILLSAAITGTVLKYLTRSPELLGHFSTITRDNEYIPLDPGGSALSGYERARLMKNTYIQLADVKPDAPTGRLAFTAATHFGESSLLRDRRYE